MKRILLLSLALLIAPVPRAPAAPPAAPGPELVLGENDAAWQPLFTALASKGPVRAPFTERRFFPQKKQPVELTGEMRLAPDLGLSLAYLAPELRIMIADAQGILLRDARGRSRQVPAEAGPAGAGALLPVLRFDLPALARDFTLHAAREGDDWRLDLTPRGDARGRRLSHVTVAGRGEVVQALTLQFANRQRIEIAVGAAETDVTFSAEELKRFFR